MSRLVRLAARTTAASVGFWVATAIAAAQINAVPSQIRMTAIADSLDLPGPYSSAEAPILMQAGQTNPSFQVAPGQVVTLFFTNVRLLSRADGERATTLPLPTTLAGLSVSIQDDHGKHQAPLFWVLQYPLCQLKRTPDCMITEIRVQIPFDTFQGAQAASLVLNDNGVDSQEYLLYPRLDVIHVLTTCETAAFPPCSGIVTHPDGSLVSYRSPARAGEAVTIYAVGLGRTVPTVKSGEPTPLPAPILRNTLSLRFDFRPNAMPSFPTIDGDAPPEAISRPIFAGLTPGQVGLYQVNLRIPDDIPRVSACDGGVIDSYVQSNLTISIGGVSFQSFDGAAICVEPQQAPTMGNTEMPD
ncbi:MAG: hypothetical protein C5B51_28750 [Terriglobia bacterium]|nr:MAG: hypothetical protein C5B51_28750 [Terriglobia bacterium]